MRADWEVMKVRKAGNAIVIFSGGVCIYVDSTTVVRIRNHRNEAIGKDVRGLRATPA